MQLFLRRFLKIIKFIIKKLSYIVLGHNNVRDDLYSLLSTVKEKSFIQFLSVCQFPATGGLHLTTTCLTIVWTCDSTEWFTTSPQSSGHHSILVAMWLWPYLFAPSWWLKCCSFQWSHNHHLRSSLTATHKQSQWGNLAGGHIGWNTTSLLNNPQWFA